MPKEQTELMMGKSCTAKKSSGNQIYCYSVLSKHDFHPCPLNISVAFEYICKERTCGPAFQRASNRSVLSASIYTRGRTVWLASKGETRPQSGLGDLTQLPIDLLLEGLSRPRTKPLKYIKTIKTELKSRN